MAPPSAMQQSSLSSDSGGLPFPPLLRAATVPVLSPTSRADPAHLAPEDAVYSASPPRRHHDRTAAAHHVPGSEQQQQRYRRSHNHHPNKDGRDPRSRSGRRKRAWKKLLWVKQSYPDNYTDQATFLESLQRNPRLQPYDFWPLVADSTVIVQHVCSVIIFVVCFVGIFQERVSPVSVVGWGSFATFLGWLLWDLWVGQESGNGDEAGSSLSRSRSMGSGGGTGRPYREHRAAASRVVGGSSGGGTAAADETSSTGPPSTANNSTSNLPSAASSSSNLLAATTLARGEVLHRPAPFTHASSSSITNTPRHSHSASASSLVSNGSQTSAKGGTAAGGSITTTTTRGGSHHSRDDLSPSRGPEPAAAKHGGGGRRSISRSSSFSAGRAHLRVSTIKSAILIYFTLLGLSPILKSLTRSTSSDSIWAMSFWLLAINIFFFDYSSSWSWSSGGAAAAAARRVPVASLSTNAALMASTVLASRLPSTGQVFSLTLFSIEVFGLFPVFRRHARHRSWRYHAALTALLVLGAGAGVGIIVAGPAAGGPGEDPAAVWPWRSGLLGMVVGCAICALAMGGCSWWLIGLQKYKNEIYGPWDQARPIIMSRKHWDVE